MDKNLIQLAEDLGYNPYDSSAIKDHNDIEYGDDRLLIELSFMERWLRDKYFTYLSVIPYVNMDRDYNFTVDLYQEIDMDEVPFFIALQRDKNIMSMRHMKYIDNLHADYAADEEYSSYEEALFNAIYKTLFFIKVKLSELNKE